MPDVPRKPPAPAETSTGQPEVVDAGTAPSLADMARLAAQLGMSVREFRDAYCDLDAERKWARYGDLD
jgi:hypothetical protein